MVKSTERFLTEEQARRIIREIGGRYHEKIGNGPGEYPPYKIVSFQDRAVFSQYIEAVIFDFVPPRSPASGPEPPQDAPQTGRTSPTGAPAPSRPRPEAR